MKWNKKAEEEGTRHRVFCCSMGDVFEDHADLASERGKLWPLIEKTTSLDWLLLTKRPENMARMAPWTRWPANAWAMTTAETQARLDELWPHLVRVPARVLGLSIEPMLSEIDPRGVFGSKPAGTELWVIAGGESGPSPRPTPVAWLLNLRDQCVSAGVPFFFKQWGVLPASVSPTGKRLGKAKAGRKLDGRTWDGFPGSPGAPIP